MPPSKKKTRSELVNEELDPFAPKATPFDEEMPMVDAFDDNDVEVGKKAKLGKGRLLHKGPLDPSLSTGKYAAVPRSAETDEESDHFDADEIADEDFGEGTDDFDENDFDPRDVEGQMDDLFAMLDDDPNDAEGEAIEDEEAYMNFLADKMKSRSEARKSKRSRAGTGLAEKDFSHLDADDAEVMRQIHALKEEQRVDIAPKLDDDTRSVLERETEIARNCVALTADLISFRMKLQPAIMKAVQLPQYYALGEYAAHTSAIESRLQELRQKALQLVQNMLSACGVEEVSATKKKVNSAALWSKLEQYHKGVMKTVDRGVERWGHRASMTTDPKLLAINRPLLEQIQGVIGGRQRLLHRAQRNRLHQRIFGHPDHFNKTTANRAANIAEGDADREIFDDGDFVKEIAQQHGGMTLALQNFLPEDTSKSEAKKGHHRRTKGRTVNYDPHPKLVGFLVPTAFEENSMHEALLASLFGGQKA